MLNVLLVFSTSLQHIAWSESLDCPTPTSLAGRDLLYNCPASNFRVFNGQDVQDLGSRLPPGSPERLVFAAKSGESQVVRMTRSSQLGIAQEHANINLDCLPWLSRFPGGSIQWKFIQLDEFGSTLGNFIKFLLMFLRQPASNALRGPEAA